MTRTFLDDKDKARYACYSLIDGLKNVPVDAARRMYAEAVHAHQIKAFAARGLLPVKPPARWMSSLWAWFVSTTPHSLPVIENRVAAPDGLDHVTLWRNVRSKSPIVLVSQPYELTHEQFMDHAAGAKKADLELYVDACSSSHFPGGTLQVEFWKRGERGQVAPPASVAG